MAMSLAMLSIVAVDGADYAKYSGMTSYSGHGGTEIDSETTAPSGLSVTSCQSRCDSDDTCDCVSFRPADGKCWKRSACVPSQFGQDYNFDTYVKASGYVLYPSKTSYSGHGGTEIDSDSSAPSGLSVESCKSRCDQDGACECVSFRPADGKCWKRAQCVPSQFGSDGNFNTYVKKGSPTPAPTPIPTPAPTPTPTPGQDSCLCIFDIDRTLTGKQQETGQCPANSLQNGVWDSAYGGGTLTLSELAQTVSQTFCSGCHLGTISAGDASGSGSAERNVLHDRLSDGDGTHTLPSSWSSGCYGSTPLVTSCTDGQKQNAVPGIINWYRQNVGVYINDENVHFFDDRESNVQPFYGTTYNARQISCATRDGAVGLCGAQTSEIVSTRGVALCNGEDISI